MYITYTPVVGADAVTKKLGRSPKITLVTSNAWTCVYFFNEGFSQITFTSNLTWQLLSLDEPYYNGIPQAVIDNGERGTFTRDIASYPEKYIMLGAYKIQSNTTFFTDIEVV